MSERAQYPAGVPCWVDTMQPDPEAAARFYGELFAWQIVGPEAMPGEPPGRYFVARIRDRDVAGIGSQRNGAPDAAVWSTYVSVESTDVAVSKVKAAGGAIVVPPFDAPPAGRMAVCRDPAGATFCLWQPASRQGAQVVNEPRAWSMSALVTSDEPRALAFYGAVFGWKPEALEFGEQTVTLWRLPGYVGGEPQQPVPRDVVAVMIPMDDDMVSQRVAPFWSVDFWVENADTTATRAAELGAAVVAPPHDVPGFRRAVISDPQGATFSISQLVLAGPPL
jgi:hypothetical protein